MPESDISEGSAQPEPDSSPTAPAPNGSLWSAIRSLFDPQGDTSLRAQLEEAIADHIDEDAPQQRGDLSPVEVTMLRNLLHFSEHDADDVAIPRGQIIAVPREHSWAEMVALFAEHGHSRMPVFGEDLDDVIGMMHIKDIFPFLANNTPPPADWTTLMRQPLYVPQSRGALDVLADMRTKRMHLAIVLDEFSGTDGIITIEDLVEEIVGDIEDEHDDAPVDLLLPVAEGVWDADALAELDDVAEALGDPRLAEVEEAVDTLGGLALVLAEGVPQPGRVLIHPSGWRMEITGGNDTRVTRMRLHAPAAADAAEAAPLVD